MKIGILGGTGKQGSSLAKRLLDAGYEVRIGSRSAERGTTHASSLRKTSTTPISGGDNAYACASDVIILAIPVEGMDNLLNPILHLFKDKIVLDITVPLVPGKFFKVSQPEGKSSYELVRSLLPDSQVVACMKTVSAELLEKNSPLKQDDFIMGLNDDAVAIAQEISRSIGLQPIRVRGVFHAHTIERMVALAVQINKANPGSHCGFRVTNMINNRN